MTPSIKTAVTDFFPESDVDEIIRLLLETGDGLTHARSCHRYYSLLHCCRGNVPFLVRMIEFANNDPEEFETYMNRYAGWQSRVDGTQDREEYRFFGQIMHAFAIQASQYRFSWSVSLNTIQTAGNDVFAEPNDLYFVPLIGGGIFISTDSNVLTMMNTLEISEYCSGKISQNSEAANDMIKSLGDFYEIDVPAPVQLKQYRMRRS